MNANLPVQALDNNRLSFVTGQPNTALPVATPSSFLGNPLPVNSLDTWTKLYGTLNVVGTTPLPKITTKAPMVNPEAAFFRMAFFPTDYFAQKISDPKKDIMFPTSSIQLLPPPTKITTPLLNNLQEQSKNAEEMMKALLAIDVSKLVTGRVGPGGKNGYSLKDLKFISHNVGLPTSSGRKDQLIAGLKRQLELYNIST